MGKRECLVKRWRIGSHFTIVISKTIQTFAPESSPEESSRARTPESNTEESSRARTPES